MKGRSWPEHYGWILPVLLLAFVLRIAYLDAQSLWWDEAFSVTVGSMHLPSLLNSTLNDRVHPPLYYLILHFWLGLGQSEFILRALSAFVGVLAVAGMFPLANLVGSKRLGIAGSCALAISPFHIWYCQEVRMYSLAVFLTLMASCFFVRVLDVPRLSNWLGYGIFTLLAVYAHYLALLAVLAQMVYLTLMRERYRALLGKWLLCMVIVGLLYAPWLIPFFLSGGFYQASLSWISPAQPEDLFWTIYDFGLGSTSDSAHFFNIVVTLLLIAVLAYVLFLVLRGKIIVEQRNKLAFVWLWLSLPLILIFLISLNWPLPQKRSVYMDRYLIPLLPAFLILICYGIVQIFRMKKALGVVITVVLLAAVSVSNYSQFFNQRYHRDQWRQAVDEIRENARSGDILLVRPHHYVPLYYYDLQEIPWYSVPYLGSRRDYETLLNSEVPSRLSVGGRLWTMIVCENADTHRFVQSAQDRLMQKVEKDEVRVWLLQNYQLLEERVYNGIYLASYGNG